MDKAELRTWIKVQLGYPTVNVELTDAQLDNSIDQAIKTIAPWYTVTNIETITVQDGGCVDLSNLNIKVITQVLRIVPSVNEGTTEYYDSMTLTGAMFGGGIRAVSGYGMYGNRRQIIRNSAVMYTDALYNKLARILRERTMNELYEPISYQFFDGKLYVDLNPPSNTVTILYYADVKNPEDITDDRYVQYLQDLSLAYSQRVLHRVLSKYSVSGSPVTVNSSDNKSDSDAEIERIKKELIDTSNRFLITD